MEVGAPLHDGDAGWSARWGQSPTLWRYVADMCIAYLPRNFLWKSFLCGDCGTNKKIEWQTAPCQTQDKVWKTWEEVRFNDRCAGYNVNYNIILCSFWFYMISEYLDLLVSALFVCSVASQLPALVWKCYRENAVNSCGRFVMAYHCMPSVVSWLSWCILAVAICRLKMIKRERKIDIQWHTWHSYR